MKMPFASCLFSALCILTPALLRAEIKLASPFTDHAVLQCGTPVPIWGTAAIGSKMAVEFADQRKVAEADKDGKWQVTLDPLNASNEGRALTVSDELTAESPVVLKDVLVGEIWLASGQSNMDFSVAKTEKRYFAGTRDEAAEIAAANHPDIRMFTGEWTLSNQPHDTLVGEWKVCNPQNVGDFSAVAYFFARSLQESLHLPVGIITLAYGASTAQAWIPREPIAADDRLKPSLDEFDAKLKNYVPPKEEDLRTWQTAVEKARASGTHAPHKPWADPVQDQHNPTVLFNGMIAPMIPYALRGVIWYQGESITGPKELFPVWNETLIKTWRQRWGRDLPFYFCQLAAYKAAGNGPVVREMQTQALKLPQTGMAVTIDIGDENNVHPKNKQDVGARLSRIALAKTYRRDIEDSGPLLDGIEAKGNGLRLKFLHAVGGIVSKEGPLRTFEIAGADGKYFPAEAATDGDSIVVQSADVPIPVSVRYAWSNFPTGCNLYNRAGLPAAPFSSSISANR